MFEILFLLLALCFSSCWGYDRFVAITPEKTGTHLLTKTLTQLTKKEVFNIWERDLNHHDLNHYLDNSEALHKFFHMHAYPFQHLKDIFKSRGYKIIFLMRDPRDQLISTLFYIRDKGWAYGPLRMDWHFGLLSIPEQIDELITGERYGVCIPREIVGGRFGWMQEGLTVRYENLVGERGGGTLEAQVEELKAICDFIHLKKDSKKIKLIARKLYGSPGEGTFRKGQIGDWKNYFNEQHKEHFKEYFGNELIYLGYEKDKSW